MRPARGASFTAGQAFNRGDSLALMQHSQSQTRVNALAIYQHRAGTALVMVTAFFEVFQIHVFAQRIQQTGAAVDAQGYA